MRLLPAAAGTAFALHLSKQPCRSALRRASKPVCAVLEEWAQQDGSSRTEPDLRQLAAQILELVTQLEQAVANLKQVSGCLPPKIVLRYQVSARCESRNPAGMQ